MDFTVSDVRDCICLDARRVARHLTHAYDKALRPSGLRITQFQLLAAIGEAEPATQQSLSELMGMDRTTLTRNLALLERDGLVDINTGTEDRRERHHRLTVQGREAVAKAFPLWNAVQGKLLDHLITGRSTASQPTQRLFRQLQAFSG